MSLLNLLPNEIYQRIIQFISPIYEYVKYNKQRQTFVYYRKLLEAPCSSLIYKELETTNDIILNIQRLSRYSEICKNNIHDINEFLQSNPLFKRSIYKERLCGYQYKTQYDTEFSPSDILRMEKNITDNRGVWVESRNNHDIIVYHDIIEILYHGHFEEILFSSIVNNIHDSKIRDELENKFNNNISEVLLVEYVNDKYKKYFHKYGRDKIELWRNRMVKKILKKT